MITGYDYWGYPIYASESEGAWRIISHDWHFHDWNILAHDLQMQDLCERWLHGEHEIAGYEGIACPHARFSLMELERTPFEAKQSRNIRAEKTRDYRKKKPKAPRYAPHIVPSLSILACLLGVQS